MSSLKRFIQTGASSDLRITDRAVKQLLKINQNLNTAQYLRVQVDAGGCHGFQYKIELTKQQEKDDFLFQKTTAKVLVDPITLDMIKGSKLDYIDELIGSNFQIVDNPKAETFCGCKISFNIK
jgi:iron-sulfur cluster assembly accessory protein